MKHNKKSEQKEFAKKNIQKFLNLAKKETDFKQLYIKEVINLSKSFNIRLSREEKLQFCKNCLTPWNNKTREIRFNKGTKEYICKKCSFVRRFNYSSSSS